MRPFGSLKEFSTGAIFALPEFKSSSLENDAINASCTFCWPSGYSAKTEFNIDGNGNLLNGRDKALVSISVLRQQNNDYLHKSDYMINNRMVKGGLKTVQFNEIYIRIGGKNPIPSYENGIGRPLGLFSRTAEYGHLISLLRTKSRLCSQLGCSRDAFPLYFISPENGVKVFNQKLQDTFWAEVSKNLNPFQNPSLSHKIDWVSTPKAAMTQKLEELINLEDLGNLKLTKEECARIAGGFGATDESVAKLLMDVVQEDKSKLQSIVDEGLTYAVRAGDYHTSRQLLILYTLVATKGGNESDDSARSVASLKYEDLRNSTTEKANCTDLMVNDIRLYSPPPPPLDTDRLRRSTNSDGLLSVLGAAEILKAMQDGSSKRRVEEAISAVQEWVDEADRNMTFRITSWKNLRSAQGDLKIATEKDTAFQAFVGTKAILNRKKFINDLRNAIKTSNFFETAAFLHQIHSICESMRCPCLRLELLQYILGLDNRYSVAHISRSVELAATCLSIGPGVKDDNQSLLFCKEC